MSRISYILFSVCRKTRFHRRSISQHHPLAGNADNFANTLLCELSVPAILAVRYRQNRRRFRRNPPLFAHRAQAKRKTPLSGAQPTPAPTGNADNFANTLLCELSVPAILAVRYRQNRRAFRRNPPLFAHRAQAKRKSRKTALNQPTSPTRGERGQFRKHSAL